MSIFVPQVVGVEDAQAGVVDDVLVSGGIVVVRLEHEVGGAAVLLAQRDAHVVRQRLALGSHGLQRGKNFFEHICDNKSINGQSYTK